MTTGTANAGEGVVIAGGGLAAQRCAETLRRLGYEGRVRMVCAEPHLPYDRPPLSKAVLEDPAAEDSVGFRAAEWYPDKAIEVLRGVAAIRLDPAARRLALSDGRAVGYDAAGDRQRREATHAAGLRGLSRTSARCARSRIRARSASCWPPAPGC